MIVPLRSPALSRSAAAGGSRPQWCGWRRIRRHTPVFWVQKRFPVAIPGIFCRKSATNFSRCTEKAHFLAEMVGRSRCQQPGKRSVWPASPNRTAQWAKRRPGQRTSWAVGRRDGFIDPKCEAVREREVHGGPPSRPGSSTRSARPSVERSAWRSAVARADPEQVGAGRLPGARATPPQLVRRRGLCDRDHRGARAAAIMSITAACRPRPGT